MRPKCFCCKSFYISWDKDYPHGCKAYQFTSDKLPSIVVKESSGQDCQLFSKKFQKSDEKIDLNDERFWKA